MAALTASLGLSTLGLCKTLKRTATDPVGGGHHETAIRFEDENAAIVEHSYPAAQRKARQCGRAIPHRRWIAIYLVVSRAFGIVFSFTHCAFDLAFGFV